LPDAVATTPESFSVLSAVCVSVEAALSSRAAAADTVSTTLPTAASNSPAMLCMVAARAALARDSMSSRSRSSSSMRSSRSLKVLAARALSPTSSPRLT
jgi:hypothetical protein